jgi:tripartite ATP-independent transporter DctM subunit
LVAVWPVAFLFVFVIGGIYAGLFTATEAAGVGAFGALVIAWLLGRMSLAVLLESVKAATVTSSMVFLIVIGSSVFSTFLSVTGITQALQRAVEASDLAPIAVLGIVLLVYVVLGCLIESLGMILLTVPIFFPLLTQLGYDPIWFGIILVLMVELGMITPPVGMNLFVVRVVAPSLPMAQVIAGVMPFLAAFAACIALLVAFPQIALWLPDALYNR